MIKIICCLLILVGFSSCSNSQTAGFPFPSTNVFTKSANLNNIYAISLDGKSVYRMDYTRDFTTVTYNYSTAHTKSCTALAVSPS